MTSDCFEAWKVLFTSAVIVDTDEIHHICLSGHLTSLDFERGFIHITLGYKYFTENILLPPDMRNTNFLREYTCQGFFINV